MAVFFIPATSRRAKISKYNPKRRRPDFIERRSKRVSRTILKMADGVGFEPTVGANPRRFSRPLP
jgi:hypothetical protein